MLYVGLDAIFLGKKGAINVVLQRLARQIDDVIPTLGQPMIAIWE